MDDSDERPFGVSVAGVPLLLVPAESRWWAIEDRCSHAGCTFSDDGEVDGHLVICNCHGSEFDIRSGEAVAPPAITPIVTFPVRTTHDGLEVQL